MTTITRYRKGEKGTIPISNYAGSCPTMEAKEDCLVIFPAPEEKGGFIITDDKLKELGYTHKDNELINKYFTINGLVYFVEVPNKFNWIAIDAFGDPLLFVNKPSIHNNTWVLGYEFDIYYPKCIPWRKSLRKLYNDNNT